MFRETRSTLFTGSTRLFLVILGITASIPAVVAAVTFTNTVTVLKDVSVTGSLSKGSGSFVIDHPLDPENKLLYHSFVESPDVLNLYEGVATLDERGEARIELPSYFDALNRDFTYQYFPIGSSMPDLHIKEKISGTVFVIADGTPGGEVSWMVTGVRKDPYILANPIIPEVEKGPDAPVNKGECLFESLCE